jgi:TM2 domain-containing membrane protein YozV
MSNAATAKTPPPPREFHFLPAFLSYLVPGLGQIIQGRVGKGVLFLVCIYTLFFYGMYLGSDTVRIDRDNEVEVYRVIGNVYLPDEAGRNNVFNLKDEQLTSFTRLLSNLYNRPQFLGQFWTGIVVWPAVYQYVHYDKNQKGDPVLGQFERTPDESAINAVHTSGDKGLELAWVYTVIAGVLNIMVIYDACAGPAFTPAADEPSRENVA